mmetsp:Transcript_16001/g.32189  ORF Transcript_16001/g.32189 Transcript_16001/m.32189 type:complete len:80 (-) Transcript_16001:267-506(-)
MFIFNPCFFSCALFDLAVGVDETEVPECAPCTECIPCLPCITVGDGSGETETPPDDPTDASNRASATLAMTVAGLALIA